MTPLVKRSHFMKCRDDFTPVAVDPARRVVEIPATPSAILERVARIPWGWVNKTMYDDDVLPQRIVDQKLRLFDLYDGDGDPIGYSIVNDPDQTVRSKFLSAVLHLNPIEMENLAMFPGNEGRGRGKYFMYTIMKQLMDEGYNPVYFSTSHANFPSLPAFYERIGMRKIGEDQMLDSTQLPPRKTRAVNRFPILTAA